MQIMCLKNIILFILTFDIDLLPQDIYFRETTENVSPVENQVEPFFNENFLNYLCIGNESHHLISQVPPRNVLETENVKPKFVTCLPNFGSAEVQLVNDTELTKLLLPNNNVTNKEVPANCLAVLFYSKHCEFSSTAAPHFNALSRAFPDIKMVAINAMMYHLLSTDNGIVGVPSVLLFHNGRAVAKFVYSEYTLEMFSKFITKYTGIKAEDRSQVTSADFSGPVSIMPPKDPDIFLGLSWVFIALCAMYYFMKSKWWKWIVETVQSNWRESEAQHEHNQ